MGISPSSRFISIKEAAERLGIHRVSAYRLAEAGKLPSTKLGGRRLVPEAAIDKMVSDALVAGVSA